MVQADTIVHFYFDLEEESNYEIIVRRYLHGLRGPLKTEEIISIGVPFMTRAGLTVRIVVRFKVSMEERPSCRHLDDYVSLVFPTVRRNITGELISTQNLYLTYARDPVPHQKRKINWEELQHWND